MSQWVQKFRRSSILARHTQILFDRVLSHLNAILIGCRSTLRRVSPRIECGMHTSCESHVEHIKTNAQLRYPETNTKSTSTLHKKTKSKDPYSKKKSFSASTQQPSQFRSHLKIKSTSIPTIERSQFRPPTQKPSSFRPPH